MPVPSGNRLPNVKFRNARLQLNLSQDGLARALREAGWTSCDTRTIQRYERGETIRPQYAGRRTLPEVLNRSLTELGLSPDVENDASPTEQAPSAATSKGAPDPDRDHQIGAGTPLANESARAILGDGCTVEVAQILQPSTVEVGDSLDRRTLLQALATLGVATSPAVDALNEIQNAVAHTLPRDESLHLDEWEKIVAEYGYTYDAQPPHVLLPDVTSDLIAVRKVLSRTGSSDPLFAGWCRVAGGLAVLVAKTLSNLGRRRDARMWWLTARQATDAAGDRDLSTWIEAERLTYGIYEGRPSPLLLARANEIEHLAPTTATRGLVHLRTVRSQLLTLDGDEEAALSELDRSREVFAQLPSDIANDNRSIWGWGEDRLRYTETWVYAHLGHPQPQSKSVDQAYALQPPHGYGPSCSCCRRSARSRKEI